MIFVWNNFPGISGLIPDMICKGFISQFVMVNIRCQKGSYLSLFMIFKYLKMTFWNSKYVLMTIFDLDITQTLIYKLNLVFRCCLSVLHPISFYSIPNLYIMLKSSHDLIAYVIFLNWTYHHHLKGYNYGHQLNRRQQ